MNRKGKLSVILLAILALTFFVAASLGFYLYNKEHLKNIQLEDKLEELNTKYKISEAKLLESQKVAVSLEAKIKDATAQIDSLTDELSREKTSKIETATDLEQVKSELEDLKKIKLELEDKLSKAQDENLVAQERLNSLAFEKKGLEDKIKKMEESSKGVELGKIVVSPEPAVVDKPKGKKPVKESKEPKKDTQKAPSNLLEGKILVLNKEYNFAVINLGSRDGVELGQVFSVFRDNNYIGDIKIEKLHDSMAAAGFVVEDTKNRVREGDRAVKKG